MVVATGPFQVPFVPPVGLALDPGVAQIHSADYRNPAALPPGKVLVVGAANSGCQIALELSATRHRGSSREASESPPSRSARSAETSGGGERSWA